jgi:hypothetical protein
MAIKQGMKQVISPTDDPQVVKVTQVPISKEDLASTLAELQTQVNTGLGNTAGKEMVASTTVIKSPVLMPDGKALQAGLNQANVNLAENHADVLAMNPDLNLNVNQLKEAISHSQNIRSAPSSVNHEGQTVNMPSDVRDIPNRLYWTRGVDGQTYYVREKADKLMEGLFGGKLDFNDTTSPVYDGLAGSIAIVAASRGFKRDPLVWASQILWENFNFDYEHDFGNVNCPDFDNFLDDGADSPILHALRMCFAFNEVRQISRLARYHNKNSLGILRKIFFDECAKRNMSVPPPKAPEKVAA